MTFFDEKIKKFPANLRASQHFGSDLILAGRKTGPRIYTDRHGFTTKCFIRVDPQKSVADFYCLAGVLSDVAGLSFFPKTLPTDFTLVLTPLRVFLAAIEVAEPVFLAARKSLTSVTPLCMHFQLSHYEIWLEMLRGPFPSLAVVVLCHNSEFPIKSTHLVNKSHPSNSKTRL